MRLAVISDIHGNIDALNAVLADIDAQNVDEIACLGDIVGYGAEPAACLALIRERCSIVVRGNHDHYVGARIAPSILSEMISDRAVPGIALATEQLSDDEIAWLAELPLVASRHGCTFSHASLDSPIEFSYLRYERDFMPHFESLTTPVAFTGHTHWPGLATKEGRMVWFTIVADKPIAISGVDPASFDVGSVGQPRDHDPRASYVIFDTESFTFYPRRVPYDIAAAQERILAAGQPERNATRLALGE